MDRHFCSPRVLKEPKTSLTGESESCSEPEATAHQIMVLTDSLKSSQLQVCHWVDVNVLIVSDEIILWTRGKKPQLPSCRKFTKFSAALPQLCRGGLCCFYQGRQLVESRLCFLLLPALLPAPCPQQNPFPISDGGGQGGAVETPNALRTLLLTWMSSLLPSSQPST